MKVAYALASVSRQAGGLFEICRRLAQTIGAVEEVSVLGLADRDANEDLSAWLPIKPQVFQPCRPKGFGFASEYGKALATLNPDLVHVHGLWMYNTRVAGRWSEKTGKPVIFTAHGMLDAWALQNSGWKKRLVSALFAHEAHRRAACWQVNSEKELRSLRAHGLCNPICVIPNGIDLPDLSVNRAAPWADQCEDRKVLLYLGRLHPKKNLIPLLNAWLAVRRSSKSAREWALAIAGWDQGGYEAQLRTLTSSLEIEESVLFLGPLFHEKKAAAFHCADGFILPSLSEGLPMVILEAWAFAKPVLMTEECNLPEGFSSGAAVRVDTSASGMEIGLKSFFELSDHERLKIGERGRSLVTRCFSWQKIGADMRDICEWVVRGGSAPATVRFD